MKSNIIITFLFIIAFHMNAFSQDPIKTYDSNWKKVEDLSKKGLESSVDKEVRKIYELAKKENQPVQQIKALIQLAAMQSRIADTLIVMDGEEIQHEEDQIKMILWVEQEIQTVAEPAASILNSLLGGMYLDYYEQNRWIILARTDTEEVKHSDLATWSSETFQKKISALFLASLQDEKRLQRTKLDAFDPILVKGNVRNLRPTLYDLLVHRALDYFMSDERSLKKPAYAFEMADATGFASTNVFANHTFQTSDTSALEFQALLLFQQLLRFHEADSKPDALIDADLKRIEFVKNKSVHPEKETLYLNALQALITRYPSEPAVAQASYLIADFHYQKGTTYSFDGDTTNRFEIAKAIEICKKIIQQFPKSEGGIQAYNLVQNATAINLSIGSIEIVNIPAAPFRILVRYQNLEHLYVKIYPASNQAQDILNTYDLEKISALFQNTKPIRSIRQHLPATHDFQLHAVDLKVDALTTGNYLIVASSHENLKDAKNKFSAQLTTISNISYIHQDQDFFVLHRNSGQPLEKAVVQIWETKYDYNVQKNALNKGKQYITDANGHFKMDQVSEMPARGLPGYRLEIQHGSDHLFLDEAFYTYNFSNINDTPKPDGYYVFTDRSIYRPGQTLYFKGIAVRQMDKTLLTHKPVQVQLKNANGELVAERSLTSNDYGTFHGQYALPQGTLNGIFSLVIADQQVAHFRVEAYKRPTFSIAFEELKTTFTVHDSIEISGTATAYAGNRIDGATVTYRVERKPRFIYPWFFKRGNWPHVSPMVVTHGSTTTDATGRFELVFKAIPDLTIDRKTNPIFDYVVYADVTDRNGETRSQEMQISVSYQPVLLTVHLPASLPVDSLTSIDIQTKNTNGVFIPTEVLVTIHKLKAENRLIRPRTEPRADQYVMGKSEFLALFPHDEYDQEADFKTWPIESLLHSQKELVEENKTFKLLLNNKLESGFYQISIETVSATGDPVKTIEYLELTDAHHNQLTYPQYLWSKPSQQLEPGESTTIQLGTSAPDVFVIRTTERIDQKKDAKSFTPLQLSNEIKTFHLIATEADRGGYGLSYIFVKHNRVFQFNNIVEVPWSNKELAITYESFRDKTLPGSTESWKIKVSGARHEQVSAEILASMYDASLDQFNPHVWKKPDLWPVFRSSSAWNSRINFGFHSGYMLSRTAPSFKEFSKTYDQIKEPELEMMDQAVSIRGLGGKARMDKGVVLESNLMIAAAAPADAVVGYGEEKQDIIQNRDQPNRSNLTNPIRTNFNETAFFYPELRTDSIGDISFSFQLPDALTQWKFQALAHTKSLAVGYSSKQIITQKELMVQPNAPRFVREGDQLTFSSKIVNLTDKALMGIATFHLKDAKTGASLDDLFQNTKLESPFTLAPQQSAIVAFPIEVPKSFASAITWVITAEAGQHIDGEQQTLPVLSNRMLVTEALPLSMPSSGSKNFKFDKLLKSGNSATLTNQSLTIEYTSNPAWYAVQALPSLMESKFESADQIWNRYYAHALAANIAQSNPKIAQVYEKWKTEDTTALQSNLLKNQALKNILIEETPWVLEAKIESDQKNNIASLFDVDNLEASMNQNDTQLKNMQSSNGGFVWFQGGPDDRYITQYIVAGIGQLLKLNAIQKNLALQMEEITQKAIPYLDQKIQQDYEQLLQQKTDLKNFAPDAIAIHYLYMRSFFKHIAVPTGTAKAMRFYAERATQSWLTQSNYLKGLIALSAFRNQDPTTAKSILASLKETALLSQELGMYWKTTPSWWWYENTLVTQSLMIEAFKEIENDAATVNKLQTWLLKNKQTSQWESSKATAGACYALLMSSPHLLGANPEVQVKLDRQWIKSSDQKQEGGTGYFKKILDGSTIKPEMGNIQVQVKSASQKSAGNSWGSIYWQYFDDLDQITFAQTPLKLEKTLFIQKQTDQGFELIPITKEEGLRVGEKLIVRIVLRVDRDMEYVHMKDMRASALEPVSVLSAYKWQGGLGYYESTKDASTNFFFDYLRKGTYVFEYPLWITHAGEFSNGITTIQCLYAPEFTAHSEGVKIKVVEKNH